MIICQFDEVKSDIAKHIREHRLIPIIGSGFTTDSPAFNGKVPTGTDMKRHMVEAVSQKVGIKSSSKELSGKSFAQIATYYHKVEREANQKKYIKDNFTKVELPEERCKLLEIDWLYIYTLNMDDGIENNSQFKRVICSNREVDFSILDSDKFVIKLHGDAHNYLSYKDDTSQIFDYKQYAKSIDLNRSLLNKLRHDFTYNNLLFIGCSLDNEFDLATVDIQFVQQDHELTSKYYFTVNEPNVLKQIELQEYGITHVVLNKNYIQLYCNIYNSYIEAQQIQVQDIDIYRNLSIRQIANGYGENRKYLFYGKSILDTLKKEIALPAYFIDRDLGSKIINNLDLNTIHVVYGPRISGKTYLLASIVRKVRDRDVYFFDSRNNIDATALTFLLNNKNTLIIFDTNSINKDRIFDLFQSQRKINLNRNNVIITVNMSDKDIVSVINNNIRTSEIIGYYLNPKFKVKEIEKLNRFMALNELPNFDSCKTILDNLLIIERAFVVNGKFNRIRPYTRNVDDIIVLILFAVNEKLYTTDLINFKVDRECFEQIQRTSPLLSEEHTLFFERNSANPSSKKFVVNAKYWLIESLGKFAEIKDNHSLIVEAYKSIVGTILASTRRNSYSIAMDYFKFDVINEIFQSDTKGQLGLAKYIYEGLHSLLSDNPHYYHQRAKCYFWQSGQEVSDLQGLRDALRFANIAKHNFEIMYRQQSNDKIRISLAHTKFTVALILSRISIILGHALEARKAAISAIYEAIQYSYNRNDFMEIKKRRRNKQDDINSVIEYSLSADDTTDAQLKQELTEILNQLLDMK